MTTEIIKSYKHHEKLDLVSFKVGDTTYTLRYKSWLAFMRWNNYMDSIITETLLECND